jgi:hypothetical protein
MSQVMSSLSQTVGSSAPVWIYRIRGADYGPMTSAVMAAWMKVSTHFSFPAGLPTPQSPPPL